MQNNRFNSASDRRWQRRYERIQQRREDEQFRQERLEEEMAWPEIRYDVTADELFGLASTATEHTTQTIGEMLHQLVEEHLHRGTIRREPEPASAEGLTEERLRAIFDLLTPTTTFDDRVYPDGYGFHTHTVMFDDVLSVKNGEYIYVHNSEAEALAPGDDSAIDEFLAGFIATGA